MIITGLYASLSAILILALAYNVVRFRRSLRIGLLDEGQVPLRRAIRMHGNAIEYLPLTLILMAIAESNQFPAIGLHIIGIALIAFRIWHAFGIHQTSGISKGRFWGTLGTWVIILLFCGFNIFKLMVGGL